MGEFKRKSMESEIFLTPFECLSSSAISSPAELGRDPRFEDIAGPKNCFRCFPSRTYNNRAEQNRIEQNRALRGQRRGTEDKEEPKTCMTETCYVSIRGSPY